MRLFGLAALLLAAVMPATQAPKPKIPRAALASLESGFDASLSRPGQQPPFDLLGNTRGLYLNGYGVVFTAELNLIVTPRITPFNQAIAKGDVEKVYRQKLANLETLRKTMRELLSASAASLKALPANEQVVVAVTLFYYSWEQKTGLPAQILMQASKGELVQGKVPVVEEL